MVTSSCSLLLSFDSLKASEREGLKVVKVGEPAEAHLVFDIIFHRVLQEVLELLQGK